MVRKMNKSLAVSEDAFERFAWYRTTFGMDSDTLVTYMMDKLGLMSVEAIREHKKNFGKEDTLIGSEGSLIGKVAGGS